jgi:cell division protein FtsN
MAETSGNRLDTAVKLLLICFISLLSFALGTFVGKRVSDSEHRSAQLEQGDFKHFRDVAAEGDTPLSEDEVQSLTEEFVNMERDEKSAKKVAKEEPKKAEAKKDDGYKKMDREVASKKEDKPVAAVAKEEIKKEEPKKEMAKADTLHKKAERVAQAKAPTPDPKKTRKPSSHYPSVASSAIGKYTVQVASYSSEGEARDHAANLRAKGFSAFYVPATVKGKDWFRVSVGLFTNHNSAMNFRSELMKQANIQSAIVQKIVK